MTFRVFAARVRPRRPMNLGSRFRGLTDPYYNNELAKFAIKHIAQLLATWPACCEHPLLTAASTASFLGSYSRSPRAIECLTSQQLNWRCASRLAQLMRDSHAVDDHR